MKRILPLALLALAAACQDVSAPLPPPPTAPAGLRAGQAVPGRFIVVLRGDVHVPQIVEQLGVSTHFRYSRVLNGFAVTLPEAARAALARDPRVLRVDPDVVVSLASTTQADAPWSLDRIDQRALPRDGAYTYGATGSGVTAYVVDSGIRYDHTEFGGRAVAGFDATGGDGSDCYGHGTHVAGTLGGKTYGVAKGVSLVSVRVYDCTGTTTWSGLLAALDWIAANRRLPAVANLSISGAAYDVFDDALRGLIASGVTAVVAAGNAGVDACTASPGRVAEAITVGASNEFDARPLFSNHGSCVDWFAPGVSIVSAWHASSSATYQSSGTSMATPHVAGAAALYLQGKPATAPAGVQQALRDLSTKGVVTGADSPNNHLLYSRVDGAAAPNAPPTVTFTQLCTGLSCAFTQTSSDADGSVTRWRWSFGDGATSTAANPTRAYAAPGTYTVTVTATDNGGATATASRSVTVSPFTLTATKGLTSTGIHRVTLRWSGTGAASVAVWRNGAKITTTANDGEYVNNTGASGSATYSYKVCVSSTCSNTVAVTY